MHAIPVRVSGLDDRLGRARARAGAAVRAFGCVDDENRIALADRFVRAFRHAGPACEARIGDFVGHDIPPWDLCFCFRKIKNIFRFSPKSRLEIYIIISGFQQDFTAVRICCFCRDF